MNTKISFKYLGAIGFSLLLNGLAAPAPAFAGGMADDLDAQVRRNPDACDKVRVIVQFNRKGVSSSAVAKASNGEKLADHPLINGATMRVPQKALRGLQNNPNVSWVSPDRTVSAENYD